MNSEEKYGKKKAGRPRVLHTNETVRRDLHITPRNWIINLVPKDIDRTELFETVVIARYGDPLSRDLMEAEKKMRALELETMRAKLEYEALKDEAESMERLKKSLEKQREYLFAAINILVSAARKGGSKGITMDDESISRVFGITFDRKKLNGEFQKFIEELDSNRLSREQIIEDYAIRKTQKGEREDEIVGTINHPPP